MRRVLVSALAVPVLLLSACGGDDEPEVVDAPATTAQDEAEVTTQAPAPPPVDEAEETTEAPGEAEETTEAPGDAAGGTGGPPTEEEQAVADRAKEWLVAFVSGDEEVCDYMLDLSSEGPMTESETDYDLCTELIPSLAEGMFDEEMVGIIESMEITGATIDGDTAVVSSENFSQMFAAGMGEDEITLQQVDGEWYVDLDNSFQ